jgi:hypothetical protein
MARGVSGPGPVKALWLFAVERHDGLLARWPVQIDTYVRWLDGQSHESNPRRSDFRATGTLRQIVRASGHKILPLLVLLSRVYPSYSLLPKTEVTPVS